MRIFLSVPFSSRVDQAGIVDPEYKSAIQDLISRLRSSGHEVFCALEHTGWSISKLAVPEEEFRRDLAEIDASNKLIILLEERVSAGVQLENGYAFAKGKQFETYQIGTAAWSNIAFSRLAGTGITPVKSVIDFVEQVIARNQI